MAITDADLLPEVDVEQLIGELYLPFPADKIKVRQDPGTGNKPLSYVAWQDYTRRLDALFALSWTFTTDLAARTDTAVAVKGSLTITLEDGRVLSRQSYGHGAISRGFPLGDAMKTASSDSLKRCCALFGIGLHLYDGDDDQASRQASNNGQHRNGQHYDSPKDDPYSPEWESPPREQGPERFDIGNSPSPATSRQIVALKNIAKSSKTPPTLAKEIIHKLETPTPDDSPRVSKKEASDLISRAFDKD